MMLPPPLRKLVLVLHITTSAGWLGAVTGFFALALVSLMGPDPERARAAARGMDVLATTVIVPASLASVVIGVVQSLGTKWGLFRHYWVVVKLLITLVATLVLFVHLQPIRVLASAATLPVWEAEALRPVQLQLVVDSGAALVALLFTTVLSVYKPRGLTPYGWRQLQGERPEPVTGRTMG